MKIYLILIFSLLLVGCSKSDIKTRSKAESPDCRVFKTTPEGIICFTEPALWIMKCAPELYIKEGRRFNDGTIFIPQVDPAEEIFQKCMDTKPLSDEKAASYKKWLKERVLEIQSITPGMTRREVNKILLQNGGIFMPSAITYSHKECDVLKVRIEFEPLSKEYKGFSLNEDDKVTTVSMPYLGFFTGD